MPATEVAPSGSRLQLHQASPSGDAGSSAPAQAGVRPQAPRGNLKEVADLYAFKAAVNPDGGEVDSNPFDVEALSRGKALVADAGGI